MENAKKKKGKKRNAYHQRDQQIWILDYESRPKDRQKMD